MSSYANVVPVKVWSDLKHHHGLPNYETQLSAGMDVRSNENVTIRPNETKLIPTGIFMSIPAGYEIQVRPRSGISLKTFFRIPNSPGTIDADYLGELCIIAHNLDTINEINIELGDRVAQIVLSEVPRIVWDTVISRDALGSTVRADGGFGSTGTK